uniref:Uncharacterized protein n=1 Tax=Rhizophora mucronata TaxID=61149 RepID=A0A2P2QTR7_RHIMU
MVICKIDQQHNLIFFLQIDNDS